MGLIKLDEALEQAERRDWARSDDDEGVDGEKVCNEDTGDGTWC